MAWARNREMDNNSRAKNPKINPHICKTFMTELVMQMEIKDFSVK